MNTNWKIESDDKISCEKERIVLIRSLEFFYGNIVGAEEYVRIQKELLHQASSNQLAVIHNLLTDPSTEDAPNSFEEMDPSTGNAIVRDFNGDKINIDFTGHNYKIETNGNDQN